MMVDRFRRYNVNLLAAVAVNALAFTFATAGDVADFKNPLDNWPMTFGRGRNTDCYEVQENRRQ